MDKPIDIRIQEQHDALTKAERTVATAVLLHQGDLAQYSLDDLARLAGVSKSTVARLFRTLGYGSYREARFESALRAAWVSVPLDVLSAYETADKIDPNLVSHMQVETINLSRTAEENPPELIDETIQALSNAPRIWVLGMRAQYPLALLTEMLFSSFSDDIRVVSAGGDVALNMVSMRKGDVLFAIGARRRTKQFKLVMKNARELGLRVVLLSDLTATESLKYADIVLRCHCRGAYVSDSYGVFASMIGFLSQAIELGGGHDLVERYQRIEKLREQLGYFGPVSDKS